MYSQSKEVGLVKQRGVLCMIEDENMERLNAILAGASSLPVENQDYILATIKGMLFTRKLLMKQNNKESYEVTDGKE